MMPDDSAPKDFPWERVSALLAGELPAGERDQLLRWIHEDPEREQQFLTLEAMWRQGERIAPRFDAERGLEAISAAIAKSKRTVVRRTPVGAMRAIERVPITSRALAWAAGLILCVGIAGYVARQRLNSSTEVATSSPVTELTTARGQRAIVQLSDGSRVTLGVASTLRYVGGLDTAKVREVELDGEAYFEVTHDARPFVVRTAHGVARDLGTKFTVRAYGALGEQQTQVVVAEGLVSLAAPESRDSILLRVADLGTLNASGRLGRHRGVDVRAMLAWTRGELVFANTPVRDVVSRLNVWYDSRVVLADSSLANVRFTSSFDSEPLSVVVRELAAAIGARVENSNGEFILRREQ